MTTRFAHPLDLLIEDGGVTVTLPDLPEAATRGDARAEALTRVGRHLVVSVEDADGRQPA